MPQSLFVTIIALLLLAAGCAQQPEAAPISPPEPAATSRARAAAPPTRPASPSSAPAATRPPTVTPTPAAQATATSAMATPTATDAAQATATSAMATPTATDDGLTAAQRQLLAGLPSRGPAPELRNEVWLNSEPLRLAELRGQVVLLDMWTYG